MIKNRIALLAASVVLLFFYVYCDSYVALFSIVLVCALCSVSFVQCVMVSRNVTAALSKTHSHANTSKRIVEFCLTIENTFVLPVGKLIVKLGFSDPCDTGELRVSVCSALAAHDKRRLYVPLETPYAACIRGRILKVKVCDSFGLLAIPIRASREFVELLITPSSKPQELNANAASHIIPDSDIFSDTVKGDDRSQVFELRDYREGDDLRNVHWPLSTKRDMLIVKEFSCPIEENIRVLIETSIYEDVSVEEKKKLSDNLLAVFVQLALRLIEQNKPFNVSLFSNTADKNIEIKIQKTEDISLLMKMVLSNPLPKGNGLTYHSYKSVYHSDAAVYYIYDSSHMNDDFHPDSSMMCIDVKDNSIGGDSN